MYQIYKLTKHIVTLLYVRNNFNKSKTSTNFCAPQIAPRLSIQIFQTGSYRPSAIKHPTLFFFPLFPDYFPLEEGLALCFIKLKSPRLYVKWITCRILPNISREEDENANHLIIPCKNDNSKEDYRQRTNFDQ